MKAFNPIELIGLFLLIGAGFWSWMTYKPDTAPIGLPFIEFGIALIFVGALFSGFFKKK